MADSTARKIILADRTDGLGERLCAMMNAFRFADMLDADFRFHWTSDIWNPVYHQLDVKNPQAVLGQSIAPQEEIFSAAFIAQYNLSDFKKADFRAIPSRPVTAHKLAQAGTGEFAGWRPNQNSMAHECEPTFLATANLSYKDAFARIAFHPDVQAAVDAAIAIKLEAFDAVHLRSGDMVFGEVRKWGQWYNKVLNPPVASHLMEKIKTAGRQVVLFGQDVPGLQALAKRHDCVFVSDLMPSGDLTVTARAIFEIVMMSRATKIYAGNSGFSRAASMIGETKLVKPTSLYRPEEYADITLAGLATAEADYHPLMAAYCYWQALAMGQAFYNLPQQLDMAEKAQALDPDNLLHVVLRLGLLYRLGRDAEAEALVSDMMKSNDQARDQIAAQAAFKYYSTDYTHRAQFNDIFGAALRSNNHHASFFAAEIKKALAKTK